MRSRLEASWPYVLVAVATLWTFRTTLTGTGHLPFDAELYHFPLLRAVADAWQGGVLPDWDPYTYGGMPLLANAQSAWAYPPHLIATAVAHLTGGSLEQNAVQWLSAIHLIALGCGTTWLSRTRDIGRAGAAFAGVFVVLSGQVLSQVQHLGMTETIAWVPFALIAADRLADRWNPMWFAVLAACVAGMVTAGFLPVVVPSLSLIVSWALVRRSDAMRATLRTSAGVASGVLLAGVALFPVLAQRPVALPLVEHGPLVIRGLLTALFPQAFGHWNPDPASYSGPGGLTATYYYVGVAALLIVPAALVAGVTAARRELVLATLFAGLTFGPIALEVSQFAQQAELGRAAYRPELFIYLQAIPLALLLGHGLELAARHRALVGAGAACAAAVLILRAQPIVGAEEALRPTVLIALLAVGTLAVASVIGYSRRGFTVALAAFAALGTVELAAHAAPRYWAVWPGPASNAAAIGGPTNGSSVIRFLHANLRNGERVAVAAVANGPEWPGHVAPWRIPSTNGFHPQLSRYLVARVQALPGDWAGQTRIFPVDPRQQPLFHELAVRYAVVRSPAGAWGKTHRVVFDDGIYAVVEVVRTPVRARVARGGCLAQLPADQTACAEMDATTQLTGRSSRTYRFGAASRNAVLLTGEPFYPGWRASANGVAVPVVRSGYLTTVRLPPGTTQVELSYRPAGFLLGLVTSLVTALMLGGLVLVERRRRGQANRNGS